MLVLAPVAIDLMLDMARAAHPDEACGLLLGDQGEDGASIKRATCAANVHPDPASHFEIDPVALIAAHKAARAGGPQVLGYWHSHPNGLAGPSPTDRAMATGDGRVWAIVASGTISVWRDDACGFEALSYCRGDL